MNKLKEYCLNITDGEHGSIPDVADSEYYFLNNNNITDNGIVINPTDRKISKADFDRIHKRTQLSIGDVVIASCGTIGKTQVTKDTDIKYDFSRSVGIIKCDTSKLLPEFLHFYFKNPETQKRIMRASEGAVQKHFYIGAMENFDVDIPDLNEQQRIVQCLSAIDSKITNNTSICSELESMAKLLYDYWFVQFDFPDENGRPYKSSGGKMVWNEELKREIPEGWGVKSLADVFEITMGSSPVGESLNEFGEGIEFYQGSTDFGNLYPSMRVFTTSPIRYAKAQDILMSVRAPVGDMNIAMNDCCIGRGLAAIHHKSTIFAWCMLQTFKPFFDIYNGSGTTFGALTSDDLKGQLTIVPKQLVLDDFCKKVEAIGFKLRELSLENQHLASLRDFLLPMLMNGQVKVGKAGE